MPATRERTEPQHPLPAEAAVPLDQLEKALAATRGWLEELVSPYAVQARRSPSPPEGNAA